MSAFGGKAERERTGGSVSFVCTVADSGTNVPRTAFNMLALCRGTMPEDERPAARYRRHASQCLEVASTFPPSEQRTALLHMAQVWQRLAT